MRSCPQNNSYQCNLPDEECEKSSLCVYKKDSTVPELQEQWAWWDAKDGTFAHVYPKEVCVRMCFPGMAQKQEEAGEGKVVKVAVVPWDLWLRLSS